MFGLAMLQHPLGAIFTDSNASLFASQFAYNAQWWARPACFDDYFDGDSAPPPLLATNATPFALHFNGPAGRHRLGWCIASTLNATAALGEKGHRGQYLVDVDRGGIHVPLPVYCDGAPATAAGGRGNGASPPPGYRAAVLRPCASSATPIATTRLSCINDRCWPS